MMKNKLIIKATLLSYEATSALIMSKQYSQCNAILADLKQFAKITKIKPHYNQLWPKVRTCMRAEL